ncbi:hypothetical protein [Anaerovirgula multivorans]|nr:hypothetical protein [Anaerovirgula multivorans]
MEKPLPKKIKIVRVIRATFWYSKSIGIVLGVVGTWRENYLTDYMNKRGLYMVDFEDCEIVEE